MSGRLSQETKQELSKIAVRSAQIREELFLYTSILTPLNFQTEKEKFFKSRTYNPKFLYKQASPKRFDLELDELEQRLEKIDLPFDLFFHLIDYLNHLRFLYHARHSIGKPSFPIYAKLAFNWKIHDPSKLIESMPEFNFENENKGRLVKSKEIVIRLEKVLREKYKIFDFKVKVNNFSSNLIYADFRQISVGKDIKRFENNVSRLIVHEVESHIVQNYNIVKSKNPLVFLSKLSDSSLYSEGLAVYNEVITGKLTKKAFDNYYYRLKAIKYSHLSFRQIYEVLMEDGLSQKHAYNIAFRVKRGMLDTGKPGGYPKDAAYLLGYKAILDFVENNERSLLYFAKNPNVTKLLMKYNLIKDSHIIYPKFYDEQ